jgi:hypothetical protein
MIRRGAEHPRSHLPHNSTVYKFVHIGRLKEDHEGTLMVTYEQTAVMDRQTKRNNDWIS